MGRYIVKPRSWKRVASSYDAVTTPVNASNAANAPGVNFATGSGAGTDGSVVNVLNGQSWDAQRIMMHIGGLTLSGGQAAALGDLMIDRAAGAGNPGSSWSSIWDDIPCGHTPVASAGNGLFLMEMTAPLFVPAGAALGFRAKSRNASPFADGRIALATLGEPSRPVFCGQKIVTLGNVSANSNGTLVTPGNTGTNGSWTSIGSATAQRIGAICVMAQGDDSAALVQAGYYLDVGFGSAPIPGVPRFYLASTTTEVVLRNGGFLGKFYDVDIPAGTQLQARATQTGSAANTLGVVIFGVCA